MTTGAEDRVFSVPEEEQEIGGGERWYPKTGDYEFTIQDVFSDPLGTTEDGEPFRGFATTEGENLVIQMSNFIALNGAEEPPSVFAGDRLRICTQDGDQDYVTVDSSDEIFKKLAQGKRRLHGIARALGETPSDKFVNALRDGDLNGSKLRATFQESSIKDDDGNVTWKGSWTRKFWASATI